MRNLPCWYMSLLPGETGPQRICHCTLSYSLCPTRNHIPPLKPHSILCQSSFRNPSHFGHPLGTLSTLRPAPSPTPAPTDERSKCAYLTHYCITGSSSCRSRYPAGTSRVQPSTVIPKSEGLKSQVPTSFKMSNNPVYNPALNHPARRHPALSYILSDTTYLMSTEKSPSPRPTESEEHSAPSPGAPHHSPAPEPVNTPVQDEQARARNAAAQAR